MDEKMKQHYENLRTEYSSLFDFHKTVIQWRFTTISFYLAAMGLIISSDIWETEKGLIIFIVSVLLWIIDLRQRTIFPHCMERGKEIEEEWSDGKKDVNMLYTSLYARELGRDGKSYDIRKPYDIGDLKIFWFDKKLFSGKSKRLANFISHRNAIDLLFSTGIIYSIYILINANIYLVIKLFC